jgi:hypothetical protein
VSIIVHHDGGKAVAWKADLDPFQRAHDRGPQLLLVDDVDVRAGDTVDYLVDPGRGGANVHCDWTYVRDLTFTPAAGAASPRQDSVWRSGFERGG